MMGFGFGGMGDVYMLIFWVVAISMAIWLLSRLFPRVTDDATSHLATRSSAGTESPLDILKRRYAQGEISKDEYEEMRRDLER